jgi:chromosome segregation ATPase
MNAVRAPKPDASQEQIMAAAEQGTSAEQFGELRSDVRHIQSDVTEIKGDVRTQTQRMDTLRADLSTRIDGANSRTDLVRSELSDKVDGLRVELSGKVDGLRVELTEIRKSVSSAKVWALILYGSLIASTFTLLARAFKWL